MNRDRTNDIAVIGLSARFPGPKNLDDWWSALLKGEVLTTKYNRDELLNVGVPQSLLNDPEYIPIRGHLDDVDRFDNKLFRVSHRDAEMMDPQHRLMLETSWTAIEDSGYGRSSCRPVTAVFASSSGSGYMRTMLTQGPLEPDILEQVIHGTEPDFIASLISYKLNLTGPAMTVQTACSSSLVGLHLAKQALRNGDCDQALVVAAGIAFPQAGHLHIPGGINSNSGICRPFDEAADGVVEGSGVACIVLKRLRDVSEKDPELYGVIVDTAINNDGSAKAGYFAPSMSGQIAVIQEAIKVANIDVTSIGYLETHGTGTPIGDPIEWTAASEAYTNLGAKPRQIAIGALKANIGHLDAASGLASLIKAMLVVKEGKIPPLANFNSLSPYLELAGSPLYIPDAKGCMWEKQENRRAAVSAFGIGGTNVHVIIEQPPKLQKLQQTDDKNNIQTIVLSAADPESLTRSTELLKDYLVKKNPRVADVSYTLFEGREPLPERLVVCGRTSSEIVKKLSTKDGVFRCQSSLHGYKPAIFLFPGQGSQYPGMAIPFTSTIPEFSKYLNTCLELLDIGIRDTISRALLDNTFSVKEFNQTKVAQPALFILQYSIAKSLINLGLAPTALVGHSLGEITAACIAGIFSLKDAIQFVIARGRAMQKCPKGAMLSISSTESKLKSLITRSGFNVNIAATNTLNNCVIAGTLDEIEAFQSFLGDDVISRVLKADRGFHSPLIEPALKEMEDTLQNIEMQCARVPIALNATGEILETGDKLIAKSFLEQARQPVHFVQSLQKISQRFQDAIYIEVGAGQILSSMASSMNLNSIALSSGRTSSTETEIMTGVGSLWALGFSVDTSALNKGGRRIHLPAYSFFGPKWMAPEAKAGLQPKNKTIKNQIQSLNIEKEAVVPPSGETQEVMIQLSNLWIELLSYNDIDEVSDFFNLGGDSLLITSLIRKVNQIFNIKVPPRKMLSARTLGKQVELIQELLIT